MKTRQAWAAAAGDGSMTRSRGSRSGATSALIAEDEPLVAAALQRELAAAWPELAIVATVGNGNEAIERITALRPDVIFLDISMPGATGLEVARACATLVSPPQIVFVTAYDQYALAAFDAAAIDYLLKPVDAARLARTIARVRVQLGRTAQEAAHGTHAQTDMQRLLGQLERITRELDGAKGKQNGGRGGSLRYLRASSGNEIRLVPVDDVLFFEAADKYIVVTTRSGELLIRSTLKELLAGTQKYRGQCRSSGKRRR